MIIKGELESWVIEALGTLGGAGTVTEVAKTIWDAHHKELTHSGDLFFTWQYDIRWAAQKLRGSGVLLPTARGDRRWRLSAHQRD